MKKQDKDNLMTRAYSAYFARCAREGALPDQPAASSAVETVDGLQYVVLRNVRGILAVYRVKSDGVLKLLKRYPIEIREKSK